MDLIMASVPLSTSDLKAQEAELIARMTADDPSRAEPPPPLDPDVVLERIGVTGTRATRPRGFLKLFPQDFLVEEVLKDGSVVSLLREQSFIPGMADETLWADLVKANIAGPHAVADLEKILQAEPEAIGWAGFKDAVAVTGQRLSLQGMTVEQIQSFRHDRLWLRPVFYRKGKTWMGELSGNRFTLLVRTDAGEEERETVNRHLVEIQKRGFINFYGPQRFGPRLISHQLGQALLRNDVDGALKMYLTVSGPYDSPLIGEVRQALAEKFGDWEAMWQIAQHFPHTLFYEGRILEALCHEPENGRGALLVWKDEVRMWIYAYASWLVNRHLSQSRAAGRMPVKAPLPLSHGRPLPEYRAMMETDGTLEFAAALKSYTHIKIVRGSVSASVFAQDLSWQWVPEGCVLRFLLPKGAYATSLLGDVFRLFESSSIPSWVPLLERDLFSDMGEGSMDVLKKHFPTALVRRDLQPRLEEAQGKE